MRKHLIMRAGGVALLSALLAALGAPALGQTFDSVPERAGAAAAPGDEVTLSDYDALLKANAVEIPVRKPGETPRPAAGAAPKPEPQAIPPRAAGFSPSDELFLCPRMTVSNAPAAEGLKISGYRPFTEVNGVRLAVAPLNNACLSSGFGSRRGRLHKGVDYFARPGVMIHAAADGVVREAVWRDDYGYMIVLDHGQGVYTRYAHLRKFEKGVVEGDRLAYGAPLGVMGNTSKYRMAVHLHFEVLTGDFDTPKRSFGLTPVDPYR
ncbi:MAG: M23 family metallopeptidase [Pseudomonadota bacterium]